MKRQIRGLKRLRAADVARTWLLALAIAGVIGFGCASPNVNPVTAKAHTGYVDLYTVSAEDLYWDVARFDVPANRFEPVFSQLKPGEAGILRLAFAPGHYQLRISFLNRVIAEPTLVQVEVRDGLITPVRIQLSESGVSRVQSKSTSAGGTVYGRYGRRTKFDSSEIAAFSLTAVPQPAQPYRLKEQMPYGPKPTQ